MGSLTAGCLGCLCRGDGPELPGGCPAPEGRLQIGNSPKGLSQAAVVGLPPCLGPTSMWALQTNLRHRLLPCSLQVLAGAPVNAAAPIQHPTAHPAAALTLLRAFTSLLPVQQRQASQTVCTLGRNPLYFSKFTVSQGWGSSPQPQRDAGERRKVWGCSPEAAPKDQDQGWVYFSQRIRSVFSWMGFCFLQKPSS